MTITQRLRDNNIHYTQIYFSYMNKLSHIIYYNISTIWHVLVFNSGVRPCYVQSRSGLHVNFILIFTQMLS